MALSSGGWIPWALASAVFASLTAILARLGVQGIDADLATFLRTIVVLAMLALLLMVRGSAQSIETIPPRAWVFLGLSGLATGASWLCYFRALQIGDASRVAPVDKLSVVFVALLGATLLGEQLPVRGWVGVMLIASGAIFVATA